ncbi:MAG: hypothetical protein OXB97_03490 [Rhodospirillales bacterium]|nr:hypothetical protein [Rhodospirillales bacterium]
MAQGQAGGTPPSDAVSHQGEAAPAPVFKPPRQPFLEVLGALTQRRTVVLGVAGVIIFFAVWEVAHYVTPDEKQRFLPAVEQVVVEIAHLFAEKNFIADDGTLYMYGLEESAQFCGVAEGEPPFGQRNGQLADHWELTNKWWLTFGLMTETVAPAEGIDCSIFKDALGG